MRPRSSKKSRSVFRAGADATGRRVPSGRAIAAYDRAAHAVPAVFAAARSTTACSRRAAAVLRARDLETESLDSSHRAAVDGADRGSGALAVRWFGTRHVLRVPAPHPFTAHELRMARAIGSVLSARYHAMFEPQVMTQTRPSCSRGHRGSLRRRLPRRRPLRRRRARSRPTALPPHRGAARRRALELREPADLFGRPMLGDEAPLPRDPSARLSQPLTA